MHEKEFSLWELPVYPCDAGNANLLAKGRLFVYTREFPCGLVAEVLVVS